VTKHKRVKSIFRLRVHTDERLSMGTDSTVRRVAEAVVAVLREPLSDEGRRKLATFQLKEWESSYHWLDANGLALYFRNMVCKNKLESCLPCEMLARLDRNYSDNQSRLAHHLVEFRAVNQRLQDAGIRFANLKGFTLEPDYCPDLSLRYQCDLDFIVRRTDGGLCRAVLEQLGYRLTCEESDTLEFKPPEDSIPHIADLYKPRKTQALEVHFGAPTRQLDLEEDCLDRTIWVNRFGITFPCLSEPDMFFSLIFHLYRHLLGEWIRLSWFYELYCYLQQHASDAVFWRSVLDRAEADRDAARALALVMAFSKQAFSALLPESLVIFCSTNLGRSARLWISHYGPEMLFSDFPGNKLYLLLLREISTNQDEWQELSRKRLLPLHSPARALFGKSWAERVRYIPGNARYSLSRARFHAREGFRYLKEQRRWKRRIAQAALLGSPSR
jgi:Uncharacterised nucleotidyltransferase